MGKPKKLKPLELDVSNVSDNNRAKSQLRNHDDFNPDLKTLTRKIKKSQIDYDKTKPQKT